jgi:hypothetical protein
MNTGEANAMGEATATSTSNAAPNPQPKRVRDIRLDFFRGICLFIIFIAHTYGNPWANFIPARFGFSDATEIFVFCSGMASAIAFGATFQRHGLLVGFGRVTFRIWQVYWAHISLFITVICLTLITDQWLDGGNGAYLRGLKFENLFNENAKSAMAGVVLLQWAPPYLDILPMYLIILCMMPFFILIANANKYAAAGLVIVLWLAAHVTGLNMVSPAWSDASWFFNPFGWQLIFFTGFAFMRGWIPAPPVDRRLVIAAIVYCLFSLPLEWEPALLTFDFLMQTREAIAPLIDKGKLGILRYIHFLALAYLAYVAVGEGGRHLKGPVVQVVAKVGQQSLGIFMAGIVLAFIMGPFMNAFGRNVLTVTIANVGGFAILITIAYTVAWYKSAPWSKRPADRPAAPSDPGRAELRTKLPVT